MSLISDAASFRSKLDLGLLVEDDTGLEGPVLLRFEFIDLHVSIDNEAECWDLAWSIADDWMLFKEEFLLKSCRLYSSEGASHSKIYLYAVIDSIRLIFIGLD